MSASQSQFFWSFVTGTGGLAVFWVVLYIATRSHPWALIKDDNGSSSTSKFQMMIWTATVVFAYLAIYQVRFSQHHPEGLPSMPVNVLIAMGISIASTVAAKAIAVSKDNAAKDAAASDIAQQQAVQQAGAAAVTQGAVQGAAEGGADRVVVSVMAPPAPQAPPVQVDKSGIFLDAKGRPDLGKVQVILWTLIAIGVFLSHVFLSMSTAGVCNANQECLTTIPDIGQTLMVLMGLGHGAYIGNKLASN